MEVNALHLLRNVGKIAIPAIVDLEVSRYWNHWAKIRPSWICVTELTSHYQQESDGWFSSGLLDPGEAGAIALSCQMSAKWFLTDDAAAAMFADSIGIEVHGTLGVVLWNVAKGHLSGKSGRDVLRRLSESSLWISKRVLTEAFDAVDELQK